MMPSLAPILLFTYKRLDTLIITITALQKNYLAQESELFIFSDAAKNESDQKTIESVRSYLKTISGFRAVTIYESKSNKGLAQSIIEGVNAVTKQYDKVIVLEDDLSTTPNFLTFMNSSLDRYYNDSSVFSISGYSFNLGVKNESDVPYDAYFLKRGWSWGWATWRNRWLEVDWNVNGYEQFKKNKMLRREFSNGGSDLNSMLDKQMAGELDSWAIRWFYYQFCVKGLTLYPVKSKVYNNGFDDLATHTNGSNKRYLPEMDFEYMDQFNMPVLIEADDYYQLKFQKKMGISARIISKIESLINKLWRL